MKTLTDQRRRQRIAKVLKEARNYLWNGVDSDVTGVSLNGKSLYICGALIRTGLPYTDAQKVISYRLGVDGYTNLENWLINGKFIRGTRVEIQAHRLAWMNKLIEEFSS